MIYFPNCKINIGLNILSRRDDGFHELETIFYPVALKEAVEIIEDRSLNDIFFTQTGNSVAGDPEKNLCIRAYRSLKKKFPRLPPCRLHLHKRIPEQAGLGGGSADASFTLKLLNDKFKLGLTEKELLDHALQLGSDCPFFIINQPVIATGRGEIMQMINLDLSAYSILLVHPRIAVDTKWAYSKITLPEQRPKPLAELIKQPVSQWRENIFNAFEKPVFEAFPAIRELKETLYRAGAIYASLSGSGSAVLGIFEKRTPVTLPPGYFQKWV